MNRCDFWNHVAVGDGCWLWTAGLSSTERGKDYGALWFEGHVRRAHVVSWLITNGPLPNGHNCVLHRCDTPRCVRPSHLFTGTRAINNADRDAKGRCKPPCGEANGSRLHPESRPRRTQHALAKLDDAKVAEIRAAYLQGALQVDLAKRFGIHQTHVSRLVRGVSWK